MSPILIISMKTSLTSGFILLQHSITKSRISLHTQLINVAAKLLLIFSVANLLVTSIAHAEPLMVTVVLSENGGPYNEFSNVLKKYQSSRNVVLHLQDTTEPLFDASLVIAVGMKAARFTSKGNALAVLNVMIPKSSYKTLIRGYTHLENSQAFSAIYLDQPIERQLNLIAQAFPERKQIGLLYSAPAPEKVELLRKKAAKYHLNIYEEEMINDSMFDSLQKVLKHGDILLALPDPNVYNSVTLRNILISTFHARVPLVGFSAAYVKAGAICAVFSSPEQLAIQTGKIIEKFRQTRTLPPPQYPDLFEIAINDRVAQSLDIRIKPANELAKEINTLSKEIP